MRFLGPNSTQNLHLLGPKIVYEVLKVHTPWPLGLGNDRKACFQGKVVFWGSIPLGPPKCNRIFETGFRRECGGKLHPFLVGVKVIRPIPGRCPDEIWQYSPTLVSLVPPSKQKFIVWFLANALFPLLPLYRGTLVDYYIKLWKFKGPQSFTIYTKYKCHWKKKT